MTLPFTQDDAKRAASNVLGLSGADAVEVVIAGSATGLTRYANSQITQNTSRREMRAQVRVTSDSRVASTSTNQLDVEHLQQAGRRALEAARATPPDEDFPGFADPDQVGRPVALMRIDEATARAGAELRARRVADALDAARSDNAAGIYETSSHAYCVVSSTGVDCFDGYSRCAFTCLVDNGESTGWAEAASWAVGDVDVEAAARRAAGKAEQSRAARDVEPGTYDVVLEPPAVATLIDYLSYTGFGAKQVAEGESFLATKTGEVVGSSLVTVSDDASHPLSVGIGFDFEGVPKRSVAVIAEGTATQPVTDLRWSRKLGLELTGHHSGSNEFGPYASNVVLAQGTTSDEALIAGVDEGLLVTRFHYVNVLDRPTTLLTGMTRDGVYRIRRGEVAEGVHNLRFTQSVLDALANVVAVGRDPRSFAPDYSSFGSTVAPALRVGEFRFTSTTSH